MQNKPMNEEDVLRDEEPRAVENQIQDPNGTPQRLKRRMTSRLWAFFTLIAFLGGSFGGYFAGTRSHEARMENQAAAGQSKIADLAQQINPPDGYSLDVAFGDLGPQLIEAGAFRLEDFAQVYDRAGQPLNEDQLKVLEEGSQEKVVFARENSYFLLNFFWALGLTNKNPVLEEGPMVRNGREQVLSYASTGGWSLAARPVTELYSSVELIKLTPEQQERLEKVAQGVYRPCCDNPTHFPDCNHGMAMFGLLTLLAANDASANEMFEAAKYANAYWYPSQSLELAQFFNAEQKVDFAEVNSRDLVGYSYSSISGFREVHRWLADKGLLQQAPGGGNSCGV